MIVFFCYFKFSEFLNSSCSKSLSFTLNICSLIIHTNILTNFLLYPSLYFLYFQTDVSLIAPPHPLPNSPPSVPACNQAAPQFLINEDSLVGISKTKWSQYFPNTRFCNCVRVVEAKLVTIPGCRNTISCFPCQTGQYECD